MPPAQRHDGLNSLGLACALCGQLFLLGPYHMFVTNRDEFSITGWDLLGVLWPTLLVSTIALAIVVWVLRRSDRAMPVSVITGLTLYAYAQFYFLVWSYGIFDGRDIDWGNNVLAPVVELAVLAAIVLLSVWQARRFERAALAMVALLFFAEVVVLGARAYRVESAASSVAGGSRIADYFVPEGTGAVGSRVHELSSTKNVVIVLLDTLQSDVFEKLVEANGEIEKGLEGFVFFRNASGIFPYTTLTVPALLTGEHYEAGDQIKEYWSRVAAKDLMSVLPAAGFVNSSLRLGARSGYLDGRSIVGRDVARLVKLALFRQVPHLLKPAVYDADESLIRAFVSEDVPATEPELDVAVWDTLIASSAVSGDRQHFKFLHFWGMHPPAFVDRDCRPRHKSGLRAAVEEQADCAVSKFVAYLERLKELGVYDQSLIFLVADTGSKYSIGGRDAAADGTIPEFVFSSAHPTIAMKDFDSRGPMRVSAAPVSLLDVYPTIVSRVGLGGDSSSGMDLLEIPTDRSRPRTFYYYKGAQEAKLASIQQMQEFVIDGDIRQRSAWRKGESFRADEMDTNLMAFVDFGTPDALQFQDLGWSTEGRGVPVSWSIARTASLVGRVADKPDLTIRARLSSPHSDQSVEVLVNGRSVATWKMPRPTGWVELDATATLEPEEIGKVIRVDFVTAKLAALAVDNSPRKLGVGVDWVRFE